MVSAQIRNYSICFPPFQLRESADWRYRRLSRGRESNFPTPDSSLTSYTTYSTADNNQIVQIFTNNSF